MRRYLKRVNDLRITIAQLDLVWMIPEANRAQIEKQMPSVAGKTDVLVLPEMFTSGFTNYPENLANDPSKETVSYGETLTWMLRLAQEYNIAITGSLATTTEAGAVEKANYVNRLYFVTPQGEVKTYDKVHLFRMADEHKRYQPGKYRQIIDYLGWRLCMTICYDLRFPVFCRNKSDYDALICVANWPASRRHHWRTLLQARAIENQSYVVGVNRVGVDGKAIAYQGDSLIVD